MNNFSIQEASLIQSVVVGEMSHKKSLINLHQLHVYTLTEKSDAIHACLILRNFRAKLRSCIKFNGILD